MENNLNEKDFWESFKKSFKFVTIIIDNKDLYIPIIYSAAAAAEYRTAYKDNHDKRKAFCAMIFYIVSTNWNLFNPHDENLPVGLDDFIKLSDENLHKIYDTIVSGVEYFKDFESQLDSDIMTCYEKFYKLNTMEYEKYITKTTSNAEIFAKTSILLKPEIFKIQKSIIPFLEQISSIQNKFSILDLEYKSALQTTKLLERGTLGVFDQFKGLNTANLIGLQNLSLCYTENIISNIEIFNTYTKNIASQMNSFIDMFKFPLISSIRPAFESNNEMLIGLNKQQKLLEAGLLKIFRFENNNKLFNLASIGKDIALNIRPFLLDVNIINFEGTNLSNFLKKRAEALLKFGWWFISSLPLQIANYIYENQNTLTVDEVDTIICDFFEEDHYSELIQLVSIWFKISYFSKREKIFTAALEQHKQKNYIVSIPTLTPHVEGIMREFMSENYHYINGRFKPILSEFEGKIKEIDNYITACSIICIKNIYSSFEPTKPESASDFNRHKLSHGLAINYDNRVNSLKLILYFNEIYNIICGLTGIDSNYKANISS